MSELNSVKNDMTMAQENAALRSRVAVLEEELAFVQEQLTWLKKQVFGRKTEQASVIIVALDLSLFPAASVHRNCWRTSSMKNMQRPFRCIVRRKTSPLSISLC